MSGRSSTAVATATLTLVLTSAAAPFSQASEPDPGPATQGPNIVLILADDMRGDDIDFMPHTKSLLGQFQRTEFLSNHPLCCPARTAIMTGQFAENNGVFHNSGPWGGYDQLRDPQNVLPTWLHDAGYQTGYVGKFANGWQPPMPEPGQWDRFNPWLRNIHYAYSYEPLLGKQPGVSDSSVHTNDAVTNVMEQYVAEFSGEEAPFFAYAGYVAPHGFRDPATRRWIPPIPAERHEAMRLPPPPYMKKPSYTYPSGEKTRDFKYKWRQRIRSLQSVDEGVRDIVEALQVAGELDNTVVVFTSDNGFLLGEHRAHGKNLPWEESLRVPLLARGPIDSGVTHGQAAMIDLAPSIAALAGVAPGRAVDGRSDLFTAAGTWGDLLIQAGSYDSRYHFSWRGTRTPRWTYVHWIGGRKELYDRTGDPYQLKNLAGKRPRVQQRLAALTPKPY